MNGPNPCENIRSALTQIFSQESRANRRADDRAVPIDDPEIQGKPRRPAIEIPPPQVEGWHCNPPGDPYADYAGGPVTVGIEWEFLVDPHVSPYGDMRQLVGGEVLSPSINDAGAPVSRHAHVYHIARKMQELGARVITRPESDYAALYPGFARAHYPDAHHDAEGVAQFIDYYHVGVDTSVRDDVQHRDEDEQWLSVKISSPAVTVDDGGLDDVQRLFEKLHTFFRIRVNYTCGLHVHVGNGLHGFPLHWVRTAAAFCWAISPLMDLFHPFDRGPGLEYSHGIRYFSAAAQDGKTTDQYDDDNTPLSEHRSMPDVSKAPAPPGSARFDKTQFGARRPGQGYGAGPQPHIPKSLPRTVPADIDKIEHILTRDALSWECLLEPRMAWRGAARLLACASIEEVLVTLRSTLIGSERMNYNFNNLRYQGARGHHAKPRTIEFRQHGGTTNTAEMAAWARVCASIVSVCRPDTTSQAGQAGQAGGGPRNSSRAIRIATDALCGGLGVSRYDAYHLMDDIGAGADARRYLHHGSWPSMSPVVRSCSRGAQRYLGHRL